MEMELAFFAQRVAMIACLSGFIGGLFFVLVHGTVVALAERLRSRANRAERIAHARIRQQSIIRVVPRG